MFCTKLCFIEIFLIFILFSIVFYPLFDMFLLYFNYEEINVYIEAFEQTWKNYPILDISLTRKNWYKQIILFDMKDIDIICDCSHIEEFKL